MTGHLIFTRSWYEYGSRSKNPGTYTVELTDGIFGASNHDVIYNRLNPVFAQTQPTLAGYSPDDSMLRLFHPTPNSTIVSRSYFTNDEITGRGMVQYSFGLIFTDRDKERFLQKPQRAFSIHSMETYDEFVKRVPDDRELPYSGKFDPIIEDYAEDVDFSLEKWEEIGFIENVFVKYFVTLGRIITNTKGDHKLIVLLPEWVNSESLILATFCMLPIWLKRKFGAVSKWSGAVDTGQKASLGGIQLLCYPKDRPPNDTLEAIIDLAETRSHRNLGEISHQEEVFAKWMWQNISSPDKLQAMTKYMVTVYKPLLDRMPFDVFAHCFWLWHTFSEEKIADGILSFEMACGAMCSLVAAFGKKFDEFFDDRNLIRKIFVSLDEGFPGAHANEISPETAKAICTLATTDFEIDGIKMRSFVKPLFNKLSRADDLGSFVPVVSYYAKCFREEKPMETIDEAIPLFGSLVESRNKRFADEAVAVLGKYASACAAAKLRGIDSKRRYAQFKAIISLFKKQNRQFQLDYASFEDMPKNARFPKDFVDIEMTVRELFNNKPPGAKQLALTEVWLSWLEVSARQKEFGFLLNIYWNSRELDDSVLRVRYVKYLFENNMLWLFVRHDVGKDFIRDVYLQEFTKEVEGGIKQAAPNEKIEKLLFWRDVFSKKCGFLDSDIVFESLNEVMSESLLSDLGSLVGTASPKAIEDLLKLVSVESATNGQSSPLVRALKMVCRLDAIGKIDGEFSQTYSEWEGLGFYVAVRMDFWIERVSMTNSEWALSRAVCEMNTQRLWHDKQAAIEKYLMHHKSDRSPRSDLLILYQALRLITESARYDREVCQNLLAALRTGIEEIIVRLRNMDDVEVLLDTADDFERMYIRPRNAVDVTFIGEAICRHIKAIFRERKEQVPEGVLKKFNPIEKKAVRRQKTQSPARSPIFFLTCFMFLLGIASAAWLHLNDDYGIAAALNVLPLPLLIAAGVSAAVSFLLTFLRLLR